MTTQIIPVSTLKKFGGIRYNDAVTGTFSYGYNFESFASQDDGYGTRRMLGNQELGHIDSTKTKGVFESVQNGVKYTFVYMEEATECVLYLWNGTTFEEKADGFTVTATNCNGIDFKEKFFFTNGVDAPVTIEIGATPERVNIDTTDALSRVPRGLGLFIYDNRLFMSSQYGMCSCENGNELVWDSIGDAGAFYKDYFGTVTAVYGFSTGIIAIGDSFCDFMTGSGTTNYSFASIGGASTVSHKSICYHDTKVWFFDGTGIYPIEYNDAGQKRLGNKISLHIEDRFKYIDKTKLADVQLISMADSGLNQLWFHARYTDYPDNSVIWIYDFTIGEWYQRIQQPINYLAVVNGLIYSAGDDGKLIQENIGDDFDGATITASARLATLDFGSGAQFKKIKKDITTIFKAGSQNDFYIRYIFDGDPSNFLEYQISESFGDTFIFADDLETYGGIFADDLETYGNTFDDLKVNNMKITKPSLKFKTIQIELICRDAGQNFEIERLEFQRIKVKV